MSGAAFNTTAAMHAVGIMENAVLGILRREEVERAGFRTEFAFHAGIGNTNACFIWGDCLVFFPHRAN